MVTRSVVQSAMHTAATALAHLPPEEWPGWIAYLCQALEQAAQGQEYDEKALIRQITTLLQERVEHGGW